MTDDTLPEGFADAAYTSVVFAFSLPDRIKILLGWQLDLLTRTWCENYIGKTSQGPTRLLLLKPRWMRRRKMEVAICKTQIDKWEAEFAKEKEVSDAKS